MIIIALANPQIVTVGVEKGVNLGIVLDGSESMIASDYNPTRLEAAKNAMSLLVEKTVKKIMWYCSYLKQEQEILEGVKKH